MPDEGICWNHGLHSMSCVVFDSKNWEIRHGWNWYLNKYKVKSWQPMTNTTYLLLNMQLLSAQHTCDYFLRPPWIWFGTECIYRIQPFKCSPPFKHPSPFSVGWTHKCYMLNLIVQWCIKAFEWLGGHCDFGYSLP